MVFACLLLLFTLRSNDFFLEGLAHGKKVQADGLEASVQHFFLESFDPPLKALTDALHFGFMAVFGQADFYAQPEFYREGATSR